MSDQAEWKCLLLRAAIGRIQWNWRGVEHMRWDLSAHVRPPTSCPHLSGQQSMRRDCHDREEAALGF